MITLQLNKYETFLLFTNLLPPVLGPLTLEVVDYEGGRKELLAEMVELDNFFFVRATELYQHREGQAVLSVIMLGHEVYRDEITILAPAL